MHERRVRIEKGVRLVEREDSETKERRRRVWLRSDVREESEARWERWERGK